MKKSLPFEERISRTAADCIDSAIENQFQIYPTMKKKQMIMTGLYSLMLFSHALIAQHPLREKPASERAAAQTQRMKTSLRLDSAQTDKIALINLRYAQKMDPVMQGNGSRLSKLKAARTMQKEKEAELKQVLTKEQFKQFKEQQQAVRDEIKERRKS